MAMVFSNYNGSANNTNNSAEGNNFGKDIFILKDEVKNDWYLYRATNQAEVKPYPVFDQAGNPCPVSTMDTSSAYSVLSEAFAVVQTVGYGGVDGKLGMIDYCTDVDRYWSAETANIRTPYQVLITALKRMLPMKDSDSTKSGKPSPQSLLKVQKNISYARETLIFRGSLFKHKGVPSSAKSAVDGKLMKVVYYIPISSAVKSICAKFSEMRDPRMAQDPSMIGNPAASAVAGLFEPDGLCLRLVKNGPNPSDEYRCEVAFDPTYTQTAMKFFNIQDPSQYYPAVRTLFGPYQQLSDILNLMTVEQMCTTLKRYFPISWIWYAWKDTPYAQFVSQDEQTRALSDPEMATWFELPTQGAMPTQMVNAFAQAQVNYTPQGYPSNPYPQAAPAGYPPPAYQTPAMNPATTAKPELHHTAYPSSVVSGSPAAEPAPVPEPSSYTDQAIKARLSNWESKYSTYSAGDDDGIKY